MICFFSWTTASRDKLVDAGLNAKYSQLLLRIGHRETVNNETHIDDVRANVDGGGALHLQNIILTYDCVKYKFECVNMR